MKKVYPAIQIAVEKVKKYPNYARNVKEIVITEADSKCSETDGPLAAIEMYMKEQAHVFFGPNCDHTVGHVALYSQKWGIPVISTYAIRHELDDKVYEFPSLTRILCTATEFTKVFVDILDQFLWKNVAFFYDNNSYGVLYPLFIRVSQRQKREMFQECFDKPNITVFENFLKKASRVARSKYYRSYPC